jgi:hypothetical protein
MATIFICSKSIAEGPKDLTGWRRNYQSLAKIPVLTIDVWYGSGREPNYIFIGKSPWLANTRSFQIAHRLSNRRKIKVQFYINALPRTYSLILQPETRNFFCCSGWETFTRPRLSPYRKRMYTFSQCCGSGMFIPESGSNFLLPGSNQRILVFLVSKPSEKLSGLFIPETDSIFPGYWIQR